MRRWEMSNAPDLTPEKQAKLIARYEKKDAAAKKATKKRYDRLAKELKIRKLSVLICDEDRAEAKLLLAPLMAKAAEREFRDKQARKEAELNAELAKDAPEDLDEQGMSEIDRARMDDFAKDVPDEEPAPAQPPAWKQTEIPPKKVGWERLSDDDLVPQEPPAPADRPGFTPTSPRRDQAPAEKVLTTVPDMPKNFEGQNLKFHTTRKG